MFEVKEAEQEHFSEQRLKISCILSSQEQFDNDGS